MWIDEFLELMAGSTITHEAIQRAQQLKDRNLPEKLYKFRAINDYAVSNFETDTVWLCSADQYNDPYECATVLSVEELFRQSVRFDFDEIYGRFGLAEYLSATEKDIVKASSDPMKKLAELVIGNHAGYSEEEKRKIISALCAVEDESRNRFSEEAFFGMKQLMQQVMKVCSFSTRLDSIVMWGHYADKHTGFAIEYDVTSWPPGKMWGRILYPVIYRQKLFDTTKHFLQAIFNKKDSNNHVDLIAAIHKSPDWSYEDEWRFVLPIGPQSFSPDQDYPIPKPSAVYLGSRITPENEERLSEIAERKGIPIYRMELSTSECKLAPHDKKATEGNRILCRGTSP